MKRILITGAKSYIGESFENYIKAFPGQYAARTVDMLDAGWENADFSGFDSVFHVAGIAHADTGKVSRERIDQYYAVNTRLAVRTAEKAKRQGVKQFIFMSSAIVYGDSAPIGNEKHITMDTTPSPASFYGDSKLQAEKGLLALQDERFKVVILRPPMIYGRQSKGNYPVLSGLAGKTPVFPKIANRRSMLYIGNLTEFVRLMVENEEAGIFHPQNGQYSNTAELVKMIAAAKGKNMILLPGFAWALKLLGKVSGKVRKAFGSLTYDMSLSEYKQDYRRFTLEESIIETER